MLLKWLAETAWVDCVAAAVAVSTPFFLSSCSQAMSTGVASLYGRYFVRRLLKDVQAKKELFKKSANQEQLEILNSLGTLTRIKTLWEFDDKVTGPLHGFEGAEHYYAKCSSGDYLNRISTPSLLIHSRNDPIVPGATLPRASMCSDKIEFTLTAAGGHVGFMSSSVENWLENTIYRYIHEITALHGISN